MGTLVAEWEGPRVFGGGLRLVGAVVAVAVAGDDCNCDV